MRLGDAASRARRVLDDDQLNAILEQATLFGTAELASVVLSTRRPHTVLVATAEGLLLSVDLPKKPAGGWAFRSTFYRWAFVRGVRAGRTVRKTRSPTAHLEIDWPKLSLNATDEADIAALDELSQICLERAARAASS
jgi:hypothetical protein